MAKALECLRNATAFGVVPLFDALHWLGFAANPSSGWCPVSPRLFVRCPQSSSGTASDGGLVRVPSSRCQLFAVVGLVAASLAFAAYIGSTTLRENWPCNVSTGSGVRDLVH